MDEKRIQEILQSQRSLEPRRGVRCPEENRLAAFVDGQLTGNARRTFQRHVSDCQSCLAALGFLTRSAEWDDKPEIPPYLVSRARGLVKQKPPTLWRWRWAIATAAAACILLALSFVIFKSRIQQPSNLVDGQLVARNQESPAIAVSIPTVEPPARPAPTHSDVKPKPNGEQTPSVRGSAEQAKPRLIFPRDGAVIRRNELVFRWQPAADAMFYTVRIVKADGSLMREMEANGSALKLGDDVELTAGATYYVTVVAHMSDGRAQRSEIVRFRVAKD